MVDAKCPRCGSKLEEETEIIDYKYFCPECDENFYEFELAFSLGKNANNKKQIEVDIMVEDMNKMEFYEFLKHLETEIDKNCGPLDWIDLTPNYAERSISWTWTNTYLEQTDEQFFAQCKRIHDFIINKDDTYRAEMICWESEKIDGTDISAEVTINARFDGAELHEDQQEWFK